jgi:hypothetical protein
MATSSAIELSKRGGARASGVERGLLCSRADAEAERTADLEVLARSVFYPGRPVVARPVAPVLAASTAGRPTGNGTFGSSPSTTDEQLGPFGQVS